MRGPRFEIDPWAIRESGLDLGDLGVRESVFALSNGHIGLRGNLDEGEPAGLPGTYLNGFYEKRPLPYAEPGYRYSEAGQTGINATNGKLIRLMIVDEPLDVRYGELREHHRTLDMRAGPQLFFGTASRPTAKWTATARVLAEPSSAGAVYLDVRVPERVAAGGLATAPVDPQVVPETTATLNP